MKKTKNLQKSSHKTLESSKKKSDKSIEIFGVGITGTQKNQVLSKVWLQRKEMLHVATVNPEYIMESRSNNKFKEILSQCLTIADGWGVVWAAKILHNRDLIRISGVELVDEILKHANERGEKVFLLGAKSGIAEKAAFLMGKKYPLTQFSWYSGARTVRVEKDEEASMTIAKINGFEPDYTLALRYGLFSSIQISCHGEP